VTDFFVAGTQNIFPDVTGISILMVSVLRSDLSMYVFFYIKHSFSCSLFCEQLTKGYFLNSSHTHAIYI
jgi:hypothetical protein